jgi:hypothetical protein
MIMDIKERECVVNAAIGLIRQIRNIRCFMVFVIGMQDIVRQSQGIVQE